MLGDVVDGHRIVLLEGIKVADVVDAGGGGGVGGVAVFVEGVVLLVEEERVDGGAFDEAELVVAHALGDAVLGVGVGGAVDGGPELVVGGVEGDDVLDGIDGVVEVPGVGIGGGEGEEGVVDLGSGGFGGERDAERGRGRGIWG